MRFTIDAAISTLALLLVLGGALWLPLVGANPAADMNVAIRVLGEGEEEGGGGGGGGGDSGYTQPSTPQVPLPESPILQPQITAISPKIIPSYSRSILTVYGLNLVDSFEITIESQNKTFRTSSPITAVIKDDETAETISYEIPSGAADGGAAAVYIKYQGTTIWQDKISVYDRANILSLRGQAIPQAISATVKSGETIEVTAGFRNTGKTNWNSSIAPLNIGTSSTRDRQSKFLHPKWVYTNRPTNISLTDTMVEPGQLVTTKIPLLAPAVKRKTVFIERFALVADGLAWIPGSELRILITVLPSTDPLGLTEPPIAPNNSLTNQTIPVTNPTEFPDSDMDNDAAVPVGGLNLKPEPTSAAPKSSSPYKMPSEVKTTSPWMSVKAVLSNWFVKPLASLLSAIGKLWK